MTLWYPRAKSGFHLICVWHSNRLHWTSTSFMISYCENNIQICLFCTHFFKIWITFKTKCVCTQPFHIKMYCHCYIITFTSIITCKQYWIIFFSFNFLIHESQNKRKWKIQGRKEIENTKTLYHRKVEKLLLISGVDNFFSHLMLLKFLRYLNIHHIITTASKQRLLNSVYLFIWQKSFCFDHFFVAIFFFTWDNN